jgi:small subunit ribosomal protein S9
MAAQYQGTGRRKRAIARVYLRPGTGKIIINKRELEEFFGGRDLWLEKVKEPLVRANLLENFDVLVNVYGGGIKGQAEAISLGIARALVELDEANKATLKAFGLLTRDPREVERKHYYRRKARKMPQYSKR